ncbi:MAG: hypothetical protein ABW155_02600 [Candidatus Thiodiazotropha sp.]
MSLNKSQMVTLFTNLVRTNEYDLTMYGRMMAGKLLGFYHPGKAVSPRASAPAVSSTKMTSSARTTALTAWVTCSPRESI